MTLLRLSLGIAWLAVFSSPTFAVLQSETNSDDFTELIGNWEGVVQFENEATPIRLSCIGAPKGAKVTIVFTAEGKREQPTVKPTNDGFVLESRSKNNTLVWSMNIVIDGDKINGEGGVANQTTKAKVST